MQILKYSPSVVLGGMRDDTYDLWRARRDVSRLIQDYLSRGESLPFELTRVKRFLNDLDHA